MAVDDLETEYHLTPNGWVGGNGWFFGSLTRSPSDPPGNRLLTVIERIYQSSGYAREQISFRETWRAAGADEKISELKKRFALDGYC